MITDIETKRKRTEMLVKVLALAVGGFLFAPIAIATIKGLISLVVVAVIGLLVVNVGIPWLSVSLANWRIKALKAAAAANPVETLQNQYAQREEALLKIRDNIKQFYALLQDLYSKIQEHDQNYPGKPSQFQDKYEKMKALLELRKAKYKQAQANLLEFAEMIKEKSSDWEIAKSCAAASKLAQIGEDFQSRLLQDTALTTIQDGLNMAFSELDTAMLDEQPLPTRATVTVSAPMPSVSPKALTERTGPPALDLDFNDKSNEVLDAVPVTSTRSKSNRR